MIIILVAIITAFFMTIVFLCLDFYKQKRLFKNRAAILENSITLLGIQREKQLNQLKISEALFKQLKKSNQILSETILDINVDLFSVLFNKN